MPEEKNIMSALYEKEPGILSLYMDALCDELDRSRDTAYNYYMTLRSLAKFLKRVRNGLECMPDEVIMHGVTAEEMLAITKEEWFDYLDYYEHTCHEAKTSFAVRISVVRGFYRWLTKKYGQEPPPYIENTERPIVPRQPYTTVTEAMEAKILENLNGEMLMRNACIIRIFLRCGLGLQEICALDMEDVELKALRVREINGESREVPIDDLVAKAIEQYIAVRNPPKTGGNPLFVSAKNGRMRRGAVQKMIRKAVVRAGFAQNGIAIRDLQLTAKARLVAEFGVDKTVEITNIGTRDYVQRVFLRRETASAELPRHRGRAGARSRELESRFTPHAKR